MTIDSLRRRGFVAALALAAVFASTAEAQAADPMQTILDRAVHASDTTYPGVALYVHRDGGRSWSGAAGKADVASGRRMAADDRFRAGSILKPFIAAATLQLVEQGRVRLDAPLTTVLPADVTARFPEADQITVRMLLNHTSGLADYTDNAFDLEVLADPRRQWTVSELLDRAAAQPRAGAPGEHFSYSNANYNLLGLVLERVTGKPWRTVIRERIIGPLGLRHTSLPAPGDVVTGHGIAHGYELVDGKLVDVTDIDSSMAGAAGGNALLTNARDLSRFLHALLAGRLFQHRGTVAMMRTFVAAHDDETGSPATASASSATCSPAAPRSSATWARPAATAPSCTACPKQHVDLTLTMNQPGDPSRVLFPVIARLTAAPPARG